MTRYYYDDPHFGRVYINLRRDARRLIARWKDGHLNVTLPVGSTLTDLKQFLSSSQTSIDKLNHSTVSYHRGQVIQCFGCTATLAEQNRLPRQIIFGHNGNDVTLSVPQGFDWESDSVKRSISSALQVVMGDQARTLLIAHAREVSRRLGVAPRGWQIGRGLKKLGHCTSQGVIQLSRALMFLPEELVDLTICHELAHLSHFDHSPAFHALLNQYLGGREAELELKLKNFQWPILR